MSRERLVSGTPYMQDVYYIGKELDKEMKSHFDKTGQVYNLCDEADSCLTFTRKIDEDIDPEIAWKEAFANTLYSEI